MRQRGEVVPDSQDEADLDISDVQSGRELSPPYEPNVSISSLNTSPSYVLPRSIPSKSNATSGISQYTTETQDTTPDALCTISQHTIDTIPNTIPDKTSLISAFSTSPSHQRSAKRKPRPKPTYAGAVVMSDPSVNSAHDTQIPTTSSSAATPARDTGAHPPSQEIFTVDISERIKARRARSGEAMKPPGKQMDKLARSKVDKSAKKKPVKPVEAVINISSDDEMQHGIPRLHSSSEHSFKRKKKPQPIDLADLENAFQSADIDNGGRDRSTVVAKKRKVDLTCITNQPVVAFPSDDTDGIARAINDQYAGSPPRKKTKSRFVDNAGEEFQVSKKSKTKKPIVVGQEPKKPRPKAKDKAEEGQIKSNEFILDSDDDLALGKDDATHAATTTNTARAELVALPLPILSGPFLDIPPRYGQEPITEHHRSNASKHPAKEDPKKKPSNKKRMATEIPSDGSLDEGLDQRLSKKPKRKEKPERIIASPSSKLPVDAVDRIAGRDKPDPEEVIPKTKTKRQAKMVVGDEESEEGDENSNPRTKSKTMTTCPRADKASQKIPTTPYAHPPKNRSLSAILQAVNGSSPRLRASPSVSRSLLTRIAPLHPNRRTPPPPPPPRIAPKKTKKELEREEKWEEELQESVAGWCELEESERERLRRAKRDWELGLCEE